MTNIIIAKSSLKFRQVYTCNKCKKQELGLTETIEIDENNIYNWHSNVQMNCQGMPIGWTSFYKPKRSIFVCCAN